MQIFERTTPIPNDTPPGCDIQREVTGALRSVTTKEESFVVNDSLWYWVNPQGDLRPCVVNSADFISRKFQATLATQGWTVEKTISGQKFDGYKEFAAPKTAYRVGEHIFLEFLQAHYGRTERENELDKEISFFYQRLVKRSVPSLDGIDQELHEFFTESADARPLRVGLEFETGNIASSFRALIKLNNLYADDHIDLGIFVTSINKADCATRIWPVTNRNGSFEELDARDFRANLIVPLWEFGFAPDRFSTDVAYLAQNGSIYSLQPTGRTIDFGMTTYEIWTGDRGREVLRQRTT